MKERPIFFTAPMVRAILEGRKTQTRRVVKPQPVLTDHSGFAWKGLLYGRGLSHAGTVRNFAGDCCPHGKPGDRLWVRETVWIPRPRTRHDMLEGADTWPKCIYSADTDAIEIEWMKEHRWKQRPSIHMPRWASRITLEITGVRVERLQDISEEQAAAEGIERVGDRWKGYLHLHDGRHYDPATAKTSFSQLWESINGFGSWYANPWVWVVEFRRVMP